MPQPIDINQLLGRVRAEAESLDLPEYPHPTPTQNLTLHEEPDTSARGAAGVAHIQSLLMAPRELFLHEAYRSLFRRDADSSGISHYQGMLTEGHSRAEVLYAMARSSEGRALGVKIGGLGWRALLCRWSLKFRKYSPDRIHSALLAGRGGKLGMLARLIPTRLLRLFLVPFRINHLPGKWLRAWENRLAAPFAIVGQWVLEQQKHSEKIIHALKKHEEERLGQLHAHKEHASQTENDLRQSIATQASRQHELEKTLDWLRYSVSRQWHQALGSTPPHMAALPETLTAEQEALDAFYIAFEDACRGSEADIREGLLVYLDRVRRSAAAQGHPIIDIGCGRGEWLRILKDEGFMARGVDQSAAMVERATAYGLDVEQGDAVAALARLPEASVGGVTGFHIVEHLPFPVLFRLFAEVSRVLAPGGIAIFETPNPENVLVGSHTFYHDPTHRNPITPTFITFLAQYHGLAEIEIVRLHPYPEAAKVPGHDPLTERVNGHLCGPQDFALVAYRPRPA
ncbi:MAG: methyltransferase domain-containing protein [Halothiobacillaceae bacterium]|nr:MAG: methyltransferase domain-containing protein [Halothiobacillaceae bacterium]